MKVPFLDLKQQYLGLKSEIQGEINTILENTAFICGKNVKYFEEAFAAHHNAKYFVGLSSGTDALHLAYWVLNIGISGQIHRGFLKKKLDEIIVPVNTYIATAETISMVGAKPVFIDHEESSFNIDPKKIEEKITERTKAIVMVHLYGQPADIDPIKELSKKYQLYLIEDCSQSHNAEYDGKKIGTFSNIATFSFYPGKNLGAYGEAGGVMTNDQELYDKMQMYRNHGGKIKYIHEIEGHNYRMEEIQGAVLKIKLKYLDRWTEQRRNVAKAYTSLLKDESKIILPSEAKNSKHVYHLFEIRVPAVLREKFMLFLKENEIDTALHYPLPLHLQNAYKYLGYKEGDFPIAEKCCKEIVSLPMFPEMTEDQIIFTTNTIKRFFKK